MGPRPAIELALNVCLLFLAAGCSSPAHGTRIESVSTAQAVDAAAPADGSSAEKEEWQFDFAPFIWAVNATGSTGAEGNEVAFDSNPLVGLDGALMLLADGRSGAWGFTADLTYAALTLDGETPLTMTPASAKVNVGLVEAAGTWRPGSAPVDVLLGLRYYDIQTEVGEGPPVTADAAVLDPILGARWTWEFSPAWHLTLRGDLGGFGLGTRLSWQAFGDVGWQFADWCSLGLGYRAVGIDMDSDGARLDAVIYGFILGVKFRF
jgi:hypothetical protein